MPGGRYTDDELQLFKNTFSENLPLVKIVRKVMLQMDMAETEWKIWKSTFKLKPLNDLMRKLFLPTLDGDLPLNQQIDLWMTVDLNNKMPDEAQSLINSRKMVIDYLDNQLKILSGELKEPPLKLTDFNFIKIDDLKARNTIISHIEFQLTQIFGLAGYKQETPEETIKRLQQDSNK